MNSDLKLSQTQLYLPNIKLIGSSEQACSEAFLKAAQVLTQHFNQIKLIIKDIKGFVSEPFNLAVLGLFSKMSKHYYSYVLLEINGDPTGSELLVEHLCEAAITLVYCLEQVDEHLFSEYIAVSISQARYLLSVVEKELEKLPNQPDLLNIQAQLQTFIAKQQETENELPDIAGSEPYLWGPQEANTTAKRGAIMGLSFLNNPARQIATKAIPASWLELQLNYLNLLTANSPTEAKFSINFKNLRDASHLCLHATRAVLEELVNYEDVNLSEIRHQQQMLSVLYEWFHNAYNAYQLFHSSRKRRP